jgi:hypothetical protein
MLRRFKDMLGAGAGAEAVKKPPYVLRASDLDHNFSYVHLKPVDGNNAPYKIKRDDHGYTLVGNQIFPVCENGQPVFYSFFASVVDKSEEQ